ncbi:MAG: DUF2510 domain-containing protein [Acidimicrobiales bacterium]
MNAPAPGWNPDPSGRHEYRYWDGGSWTDDVSDNGVTSVDPVAGGASAASVGGAPTALGPPTQQYTPQAGGFPPQQGGYDPYGSGQVPPAKPARSGPSTGLIVGLAAVAVAVIVGLAFILTSGGDDDDTAADDIASSGTTEPGGDAADGDTGLGDLGDLGDLGENGEDVSTDGIVELIASGIELEADGLVTHEQAVCAAQAMVDHFGVEGLIEAGGNGEDPFATASAEDQAAIITAMTDCIPVDVLAQIGMAQSEGG